MIFLRGFMIAVLGVLGGSVSLAQAQELRLITSPWPPSNYLDEAGQPTGLSVAIVEALKAKLGLSTPIEVLPWARGYLSVQDTPDVMLFTGGRTQERIDMGLHFIGPAVMWNHVLLSRSGSGLAFDDLDQVRREGLTVAGVRGSWQLKLIEAAGVKTVETADQKTGARMLLAKRVDLWVTSHLQGSVVLNDAGFPADRVEPVFTIRRSPSYLMVSTETDPAVLEKWQAAYEELKATDYLQGVARDWSAKLGIQLRFDPEEGFSAVQKNARPSGT